MTESERDPTADPPTPSGGIPSFIDSFPCALYGYVRWPDGRNKFVYMSAQSQRIFGHSPERIVAEPQLLWKMVHPDDLERLAAEDERANRTGEPFDSEVRIITPTGEMKWIQLSSMESPQLYDGRVLWSGVILDITARKQAEEEKSRLVEELRQAISRIRRLEGILPICSYCKKIRDDDGAWQQIDIYVREHSDTDFSHGICPDCLTLHFPGE